MNCNIENSNCLKYTITENDRTVKEILINRLNFSKKLCLRLERDGKVFLNNNITKLNKSVFLGDEIEVVFEDESEDEYDAVNIPLKILYEDDDVLVVDKPPFMVVHPTKSHFNDTLANGVKFYFIMNKIKSKVRLVNRLDMNTSGIVIIAKNSFTHNELCKQMKENIIDKYYLAIAEGLIENDKGTINAPIARLNPEEFIRVVDESGKECITHYEVVKRFSNMTLVRLKLDTGRTHQIRVHLKHIGHPIVGDTLYNGESDLIDRQALHCTQMSFVHPISKKRIEIVSEIPEDFQKIIEGQI